LQEYTFKKSTAERYDLWFRHGEWATFTIDENGGLFNCHSSFGDYNYSWPYHGRESFKHFILELAEDPHYLLGKVAKQDYFDFDKAQEAWKRTIINERKCGSLNKDDAREAFDYICNMEYSDIAYAQVQIYNSQILNKITGNEPYYEFPTDCEYNSNAKYFAHEVMPMFADILKKELLGVKR
jgi:hypothetical protein